MFGMRYQFREFLIAIIVFLIANVFDYLREIVVLYSIFLIFSFLEEAVRGYFNIESRVKSLRDRLHD